METIAGLPRDVLYAYLPSTLIEHWTRRPQQAPIWGHWLDGSLMHCDVTGFTAMSESLAELDKEGAELMVGVLNRFFEKMLDIADRWGGAQLKFGGDAMLLFFSGRGHPDRAAACGFEMQSGMGEFSKLALGGQAHQLRMRIGIHSGRAYAASVGQKDGTLHYLLLGPEVNYTASVEPKAGPGQVVVSDATAALLGAGNELAATPHKGIWRVRSVGPAGPAPSAPAASDAPVEVLRRYLMPPLAEGRLTSVSGEHRRVTVVFVNLLGASRLLETRGEATALAQVDAYMKTLISAVEKHNGFVAASDVAEDGDKIIALFGAPVTHENGDTAAVRCAWELDGLLRSSGLELTQRMGINSGFVFAGEVGSGRRREYTVIGDNVNLAARLMAAARPGQTLVSESVANRAADAFELHRARPIRVKGKRARVRVFRLEAERAVRAALQADAPPMVGRGRQMAALLRLAQRAAEGRPRWAFVSGEAGMGKSRLTAELATRLAAQSWLALRAECQPHTSGTPFAAWLEPLRAVAGIESSDSPDAASAKLIAALTKAGSEAAEFAPLVAELLSLPTTEQTDLVALDARSRRQHLTEAIVALIAAAASERPLVLLFEDAHWSDGASLELLSDLLGRADVPLLACVTSRQKQPPGELARAQPQLNIALRELSVEDARRLVAASTGLGGTVPEAILEKAQGNPLFLRELAQSDSAREGVLPETINDVIMARLDALPAAARDVLCFASVIGPSFDIRALQRISSGALEGAVLEPALATLAERGFAHQRSQPSEFAFSHALVREAAYETLPYARRRRLHRAVAGAIEEERESNLESVCELLLHHYRLSGDAARTVRYAAMSGDKAAAIFACREAVAYYQDSLGVLEEGNTTATADRSLLLERLGDTLEASGDYRQAGEAFERSLDQWRRGGRRARARFVPWSLRASAREALLCQKVAVTCERRSNYDESLRWLDEALSVLPPRAGIVGAHVFAAKSMSLFRKGLYEEAIPWGRMGLAASRRSHDPGRSAYAHRVLANSYIEQGALRQAVAHLRPAARLYHELSDLPGQAMANSNLAASYQLLGMLDGALYHYEVALRADEQLGNVTHAAIVHNNLGEVLLALGRVEEAEEHLTQVVDSELAGSDLAAVAGLAHVNLARCRQAGGRLDDADWHLRRGLRLLRKVGAEGLIIEQQLQLAELRLAQGRPAAARRLAMRCLVQARDLSGKLLEARGERILAAAEAAQGNEESARSHIRSALALARRIGADHEVARCLMAQGEIAAGSASARAAGRRGLQRAIAILSRIGAERDLAEARRLLARFG